MTQAAGWLLIVLVASGLTGPAARCGLAADPTAQATASPGSAAFRPSADRPVGWRGDGGGQYPSADPVSRWSEKENVLWKTEVGAGQSSPIVVGPRVFITAEPDWLICLDAETGKETWRKAHKVSDFPAASDAKRPVRPSEYGDATPTPVSDGNRIWVFFGTGIVACYDLDGKCRWANWYDMRRVTTYGRTASPLLVGDRLLVHFGPLVCLDAATGRVLWQDDGAKAAYGTPAPARIGDVDVVVTPKGHVVRLADGKVLAADLGNCMYTSPVVQGRVVYFIGASITAVEFPDKADDPIKGRELWYAELDGEFYASPVVHDGRIYTVDRAANYFVIDAATGKTLLKKTLEMPPAGRSEAPNVYPSICLAGKRLLICNDAGDATLLEPGDQGSVVARNALPGGSGGTPTLSGQRMFLRCGKVLYGLGPALLRP